MTFDEINVKFLELYQLAETHLIPEAIELITLPIPYEPKDELYFNKLVSWGYSLIFESFPVLYKRLAGQVRQSDVDGFKKIDYSQKIIHALRTIQSHNMPKNVKENINKNNLVDLWYETNAPDSTGKWMNACNALCKMLFDIASKLHDALNVIISDTSNAEELKFNLILSIKNDWPAYTFDDYVNLTAREIGVIGMNVVNYRTTRLKEWKALAALFEDTDTARKMVERRIKTELIMMFGQS